MNASGSGRAARFTLSIAGLVLLWWLAAYLLDSRFLPGPVAVAVVLWDEAADGRLFFHLGMTLMRVAAAFVIAFIVGSLIGFWLGSRRVLDDLFLPWLVIVLNIPALVVIVLAYIWFGLTEVAAIGAVALNKLPVVAVTMREGSRSLDRQWSEMAQVFRFSTTERTLHVVLPQLQPYFAAAARSGLSLVWKIVLVVELLGRSNGVGFQIHLLFQTFDVTGILAYTCAFVAVILLIDALVLQPLERRATRWRGNHA